VKDETGKESDGMDEGIYGHTIVRPSPLITFSLSPPSVIFPADFQSTSHIVDDVCVNSYNPNPISRNLTSGFLKTRTYLRFSLHPSQLGVV
jgi:hypothetical protein